VVRLVIEKREPYAGGQPWGNAGPYEHIVARAYHEVDPTDPHNKVIYNLDKAPRNARGMVEFSTPVFIIKPVNMALGNGKIFYNVNNRGNTNVGFVADPAKVGGHVSLQLKRGFTLVDAGWHGDGIPNSQQLFPDFPIATQGDGKPIISPLRLEFSVPKQTFNQPFAQTYRAYKTADTDTPHSTLLVRERAGGPAVPLSADKWAFGTCPTGKNSLKATVTDVCLFDGFSPDRLYELTYPARDPVVMGLAYAVTRDVASFVRYQTQDDTGTANPLALPGGKLPRLAYVFGASSTGMYLRDWLYLGFNEDEQSRKVFDGAFIHTGGALRLFANVEFSHPTFYAAQDGHADFLSNAHPPFTYGVTTDPVSGVTDGILKRPKTDPLLMEVVDENSFWNWKNSLQVVDGRGHPITTPPGVRLYFKSGSGHLGLHGIMSPPLNPHGFFGECLYTAQALAIGKTGPSIAGALMVDLDDWVDKKITPPESNFPTQKNGELITLAQYQKAFPKIPGVEPPKVMARLDVLDFGPEFNRTGGHIVGIAPQHGAAYSLFVPRPDKDGMAVASVRPIEVSVPIGTNIGWNVRLPGKRAGELCGLEGSFFPFARTKAERLAANDPRHSLEERYGDHAGYVAAVRKAAADLVSKRYFLPEDAADWVKAAEASDVLAAPSPEQH
jgi:hypothetical protein